MNFHILLCGTMVSLCFANSVVAAGEIIYETDFDTASQPSGVGTAIDAAGRIKDGFHVTPFTPGPGYSGTIRLLDPEPQGAGDFFVAVPAGKNGGGMANTLEDALENGDYFEFTLTAPMPVHLADLTFSSVGYGSTAKAGVTVRSSVDNFTSDLATASGVMSGGKSVRSEYTATARLSAISGLAEVKSVTFRFYFYDDFAGAQNRFIGIDDISLSIKP